MSNKKNIFMTGVTGALVFWCSICPIKPLRKTNFHCCRLHWRICSIQASQPSRGLFLWNLYSCACAGQSWEIESSGRQRHCRIIQRYIPRGKISLRGRCRNCLGEWRVFLLKSCADICAVKTRRTLTISLAPMPLWGGLRKDLNRQRSRRLLSIQWVSCPV